MSAQKVFFHFLFVLLTEYVIQKIYFFNFSIYFPHKTRFPEKVCFSPQLNTAPATKPRGHPVDGRVDPRTLRSLSSGDSCLPDRVAIAGAAVLVRWIQWRSIEEGRKEDD